MLLTTTRWTVALVILLPFAWPYLVRDRVLLRQHAGLLLGLGAFGMCLFNVGLFTALHYTSAINVSIEQAAMPVLIMLLNFAFLRQRVGWLPMLGVALTLLGVAVTASHGDLRRLLATGLNRGDAIMLLGASAYALYTFGLRWRPPIHWTSFLCAIATGGALASLPLTALELYREPWPTISVDGWLVLGYIVLFPTMISQMAFVRGVTLIGANRAGLFINLVPIFGSLLAVVVIGERFQAFHAIGMALVIGGILLAERSASSA